MNSRIINKIKTIIPVLLVFGVIASCGTSNKLFDKVKAISDLKEMGLKGAIKSMTVRNYRASKNINTGTFNKKSLSNSNEKNVAYKFNENGNIVEKKKWDTQGKLKRTWRYTYNMEERQVIEKVYNRLEKTPVFKRIFFYNDYGNKIKYLSYSKGDNEPYKEIFEYKNGKLVKVLKNKHFGLMKEYYEYNQSGQLMKKANYKGEELQMEEVFEYDEQGGLVSSRQTERRTVYSDYVFVKKYAGGKEIERKVLKNEKVEGRYIYKYNVHGDRIGYKKLDAGGEVVSEGNTIYEYDKKSNWIKKIPLNARGLPWYITERVIVYE